MLVSKVSNALEQVIIGVCSFEERATAGVVEASTAGGIWHANVG